MAETSTKRSPQSNGQLRPNQKMRTTCNACQQAKIRCSHTYPCNRCESHGYECVYSISQPLGRPAKKKTTRSVAAGEIGKARGREGEVVDRPTRRGAGRAPRPTTVARVQRARRVPSRVPSPTTASGSGPGSREESHKSDSRAGTEVTPPEEGFQWPSFTAWFLEVPGEHRPSSWVYKCRCMTIGMRRKPPKWRRDPGPGSRQHKRVQYQCRSSFHRY